jgi:hypothetical protein
MITTNTQLAGPASGAREIVATPNATADNAVVSTACKIVSLVIDNSANSAASYVKLYDNAAPTVGTTVPDEVIYVRAGRVRRINYSTDKLEFNTALSWACVTTGGTSGVTAPTSSVSMTVTVHT